MSDWRQRPVTVPPRDLGGEIQRTNPSAVRTRAFTLRLASYWHVLAASQSPKTPCQSSHARAGTFYDMRGRDGARHALQAAEQRLLRCRELLIGQNAVSMQFAQLSEPP